MGNQPSRFSILRAKKYRNDSSIDNHAINDHYKINDSSKSIDMLSSQRLLHDGSILDMKLLVNNSNDGVKHLYTCGDDNQIVLTHLDSLLDPSTPSSPSIYYKGHTRAVNRLHMKSQLLCSVSRDLTLRLVLNIFVVFIDMQPSTVQRYDYHHLTNMTCKIYSGVVIKTVAALVLTLYQTYTHLMSLVGLLLIVMQLLLHLLTTIMITYITHGLNAII